MSDKAIKKGLKELKKIKTEYEKKVIEQEKWADNYNVMFFVFITILLVCFVIIPDLIYFLLFGLICFTDELCALILGIGLIGISPSNKSKEMRNKLNVIDSAINALEAGRTGEAYGIWTGLILNDGLDDRGMDIIRDLWIKDPTQSTTYYDSYIYEDDYY